MFNTKSKHYAINRFTGVGLFLLFLTISLLFTTNASFAQLTCPVLKQATPGTGGSNFLPSTNTDGGYTAFISSEDYTGENPTNERQVFRVNAEIEQGTFISSGQTRSPSTNGDGSLVAFQSDSMDLGNNPEGNNEIYLYNFDTDTITQITQTTGGGSFGASVSKDGNFVAYESDGDVDGLNPGGFFNVFLYNRATGTNINLTNANSGESAGASVNGDGSIVAFDSTVNLTGQNPGNESALFIVNTNTLVITQLTPAGVSVNNVSISSDGTTVAFDSRSNINDGNPDGNTEIYFIDVASKNITQVTNTTSGNSRAPSIDDDGGHIAFHSDSPEQGVNPDGQLEIYYYGRAAGKVEQVTFSMGEASQQPSLSGDGSTISFRSEGNLTGENPSNYSQIFLARCFDRTGAKIPTLGEWGLLAMALVLGAASIAVIRKRRQAV